MIGHFDSHLNLRKLILDKLPKVIVEVGAGDGANTRMIAFMQHYYPFEFHVISDKELPDLKRSNIHWKTGISYKELALFPDNSIDMCIIDTDHNYWTLEQELNAVFSKMNEGGLIIMHDVEEFYYNTGLSDGYWDDSPYPKDEIMEKSKWGGTGLALIDFLHKYRGAYKLVRWIPEHFGCAVIEKRTVEGTNVISPGPGSVFARPKP